MREDIKTKYGYDLVRADRKPIKEREAALYYSAPQLLAALRLAAKIIALTDSECSRSMMKVVRQAEGGERTSKFLVNE